MGNFSAGGYSQALASLASVPSQVAARVATRIRRQIALNFSAGVDPYGRAWAPLAPATLAKGRHPPPLTDTSRGRQGIRVFAASGAGIQITSSVSYMGVHQDGSGRIPARKFLPEYRLPAKWKQIWQDELAKATRRRLSGG